MARFSRLEVLNEILRLGLVPVFYQPDLAVAREIVAACAAGGAGAIEFTNRGDNAQRVFADLLEYVRASHPTLVCGVGSVVDPLTAGLYVNIGADFVVGPVFNAEIARLCNRRKVAYCPGCATPSEISNAEEWGVELVKVFPGQTVGGPAFVKSVLAPMPWTRIMPTGGVDATWESIQAWFGAGAAAVGMGSKLISKSLVAARDFDGIAQRTAQVLAWIARAREGGR